jgi:hypothetical protein
LDVVVAVQGTKAIEAQVAVVQDVPPVLASATPLSGPMEGDTIVTITGQHFEYYTAGALMCVWGSYEIPATIVDATHILCATGRHAPQSVPVTVRVVFSDSLITLNQQFSFYQTVFIADSTYNSVLRFRLHTGDFIDEFVSAGSGGLSNPAGMAFGLDENFYIASAGTSKVLQYHGRTGQFIKPFCTVEGAPRGLTFHYEDLYVCDPRKGVIHRYNGWTGSSKGTYAVDSKLSYPWDLLFEKHTNNTYVSDEREGQLMRFNQPSHGLDFNDLAMGVDTFQGKFEKVWTDTKMDMVHAFDITPHSVYLTSPHANIIVRYNRTDGAYIDHFTDPELTRAVAIKAHGSTLHVCSGEQLRTYQQITGEFFRIAIHRKGMKCASLLFHTDWDQNQGVE